jgi:hypothetical protein
MLLFPRGSKSVAIAVRNIERRRMCCNVAVKLLECAAKTLMTCRLGRVGGMWYMMMILIDGMAGCHCRHVG